jgi:hypothetical protein
MRFDVSRRGEHQIRSQERKITSDSISGEEDNSRLSLRRRRENAIRCQKKKRTSD